MIKKSSVWRPVQVMIVGSVIIADRIVPFIAPVIKLGVAFGILLLLVVVQTAVMIRKMIVLGDPIVIVSFVVVEVVVEVLRLFVMVGARVVAMI